jgi:trans-aconitate 2-methyltransferase
MPAWNPDHYEQFVEQRRRPGRDLIARIEHPGPFRIVDLGCGTGRLTEELAARWPEASVTGIDRSSEMLPEHSERVMFELGDIETWEPDAPVDVLFANASLHWLPEHAQLFPRLLGYLTAGGVLAVQMPLSWDQPSHRIMRMVAEGYGIDSLPPPTLEPIAYYDILAAATSTDVWVTTYLHVLEGDNPVYEWVSATGMQRFVKRIDPLRHATFHRSCAERLAAAYPRRSDGTTVYPFIRLFITSRL